MAFGCVAFYAFVAAIVAGACVLIFGATDGWFSNSVPTPATGYNNDSKQSMYNYQISEYKFMQCLPSPRECCNGLESNCDYALNEILFATSHNAMSSREEGFFPPNNDLPLEDALDAGIRGLLLDLCICEYDGVPQLTMCHKYCLAGNRTASGVFESIVSFLERYPTEVLIVEMEFNTGVSFENLTETMNSVSGLSDLIYVRPNNATNWPKMRSLVDNNERLVLFQHNGPDCSSLGNCIPGVLKTFDYMFETPYNAETTDALLDFENSCTVKTGKATNDFFLMNEFATKNGIIPTQDLAAVLNSNSFLEKRTNACEEALNKRVNLMAVDFWSVGDLMEFTQDHNKALIN